MAELGAFTTLRLSRTLHAAARRTAERQKITVSDLLRSALARAVEREAATRRRKPEKEKGVGPPT